MTAHLLVDAHVHFHSRFTWRAFLEGASANFARARRDLQLQRAEAPGCLMLTETAGVDSSRTVRDEPGLVRTSGWDVHLRDGLSVVLSRGPDVIVMVAGRQIVTEEHLEVLALGCADLIPDGQPIRDVVRRVSEHDGVAVIPWGFGKWWGRRGRLVRAMLDAPDVPRFCLGDNGGRAHLWPRPRLFAVAERCGTIVLPGSDPLPLATHVERAGSYGFVLDGEDEASSLGSEAIIRGIRKLRRSPAAFGSLSSLGAMVRSQVALRSARAGRGRHTLN